MIKERAQMHTIFGPNAYESTALEISFVTANHASEAAFVTECQTLEAAFRTPRGDFVWTLGATVIKSLKQSNNTGFDCRPTITKQGDQGDTGRSRRYTVRFDFGLPADNVGTSFRQDSSITVDYSPSRKRTVTIQGTYTANSTDGTTGAYAQYNAQIAAYATTVLTGVDGAATWELVSEPQTQRNETDKNCTFIVVYREIIFNQSASGLDDTDIIDPTLIISRNRSAPGDSTTGGVQIGAGTGAINYGPLGNTAGTSLGTSGATVTQGNATSPGGQTTTQERPTVTMIDFSCNFNKNTITSLASMKSKWENNLRGYLIDLAGQVNTAGVVLIDEKPSWDTHERRMTATMEFHSYPPSPFEATHTITDHMTYSKVMKAVWNGDPYARYVYQGPALKQRIVVSEYKIPVASSDPVKVLADVRDGNVGDKALGLFVSEDQWELISRKPSANVKVQGLVGAKTVFIAEITIETIAERRNKKKASTANVGGVTGVVGGVAT